MHHYTRLFLHLLLSDCYKMGLIIAEVIAPQGKNRTTAIIPTANLESWATCRTHSAPLLSSRLELGRQPSPQALPAEQSYPSPSSAHLPNQLSSLWPFSARLIGSSSCVPPHFSLSCSPPHSDWLSSTRERLALRPSTDHVGSSIFCPLKLFPAVIFDSLLCGDQLCR